MALRVDFHDIKRALDGGSITPIEALFKWTTWALKQRTLELKPYFHYVRETLPIVTWHQPGEELLVHGYLPVTWTCPMDFYQWADNFMGLVFSMGAHLRRFIAEKDPQHAAVLLEGILAQVDLARRQTDPASPEFVRRGGDRKSEGIKASNTSFDNEKPSNTRNKGSVDKPGTLRRLARSHPDLLARVESGELSAHAAAVQAGIRKPMRSIPVDTPEAAIRALLRVFTVTDLAQALGKAAEVSPPS